MAYSDSRGLIKDVTQNRLYDDDRFESELF